MSLSRGLMVRSYLTEKGISPSRLDVRALGAEGDAPPSDQVELVFVK
jgi:outer membrane protein OmpA-like peptidoglycan-associated protein